MGEEASTSPLLHNELLRTAKVPVDFFVAQFVDRLGHGDETLRRASQVLRHERQRAFPFRYNILQLLRADLAASTERDERRQSAVESVEMRRQRSPERGRRDALQRCKPENDRALSVQFFFAQHICPVSS